MPYRDCVAQFLCKLFKFNWKQSESNPQFSKIRSRPFIIQTNVKKNSFAPINNLPTVNQTTKVVRIRKSFLSTFFEHRVFQILFLYAFESNTTCDWLNHMV